MSVYQGFNKYWVNNSKYLFSLTNYEHNSNFVVRM